MKVVGLTGGIGVGKSLVARLFLELGSVPTLDADQVARRLREPGEAGNLAILNRFGTCDRAELRELISKDPSAKADLERILHPLIKKESDLELERLKQSHPESPFLLYEASLLIEAGRAKDFDAIIVVTAPLPDRIARITSRDQVTPAMAVALIEAQSPDSYRLKHAHYHIQNLGTIQDLRAQVGKILDQIKSA